MVGAACLQPRISAFPMFNRISKNKHQYNDVKKECAFINKKIAPGQVRMLIFFKIIMLKFQLVTICQMLSNRFSNNINNKDRFRSVIFFDFLNDWRL
jgi:hypothetical protein